MSPLWQIMKIEVKEFRDFSLDEEKSMKRSLILIQRPTIFDITSPVFD
jgi:hypothetical protein